MIVRNIWITFIVQKIGYKIIIMIKIIVKQIDPLFHSEFKSKGNIIQSQYDKVIGIQRTMNKTEP